MSDRARRRERLRHRRAVERIEQLERELGLADDGLVDLSTDPPAPVPSLNLTQVVQSPFVALQNRVGQRDPVPPQLRLDWDVDSRTGGLVAREKPVSLVPLYSSAYCASAVPSPAGRAYRVAVERTLLYGADG